MSPSLWSFVSNASIVVKCVLLLLTLASIASWTIIFSTLVISEWRSGKSQKIRNQFWSGTELHNLYTTLDTRNRELSGLEHIFCAGFEEFSRLSRQTTIIPEAVMEGTERAMRIALAQEVDKLEQHLPFLATVGSTSPYVGLFGTVWGIMTSFRSLGVVQQATNCHGSAWYFRGR